MVKNLQDIPTSWQTQFIGLVKKNLVEDFLRYGKKSLRNCMGYFPEIFMNI